MLIHDQNVAFVDIELEEKLKEIRKFLKKPSLQFVSIATEDYLVEVVRRRYCSSADKRADS